MRITATVKPNAKRAKTEKIDDAHFVVSVTAPPHDGKANRAVILAIAAYFDIAPSRVTIVSGLASRRKIIEII